MVEVPSQMTEENPVPGSIVISLLAQEDMNENTLVTWGTEDKSCAMADATDYLLGWTQGKAVEDEMASIHLPVPMWKVLLHDDSHAVNFGDTLEQAADGTAKKFITGSGNSVCGKAMSDGVAEGHILMIPITCCPTGVTS